MSPELRSRLLNALGSAVQHYRHLAEDADDRSCISRNHDQTDRLRADRDGYAREARDMQRLFEEVQKL